MASEERTGPGDDRAGSETKNWVPPSVPLGPHRLLVAGEWVDAGARVDWRDRIDLADAEPHVIYAAGVRDGFDLAISQLQGFAELMADRLSLEQAFERAVNRYRRSV